MSYTVYILYSHKDKKLYIGCTSNIISRFNKHKNGYVNAIKHRLPLDLIHTENYDNKTLAFNRERFLKSLWGSREIK
jgi:putative endonuclease